MLYNAIYNCIKDMFMFIIIVMRLSNVDKTRLLSRLPNLKLSYEKNHNKVSSDMYFLIPYGRKCLVWFTYFEDKKVCVFVDINKGNLKDIVKVEIIPQVFEKKLVLGTIFFGTMFNTNKRNLFTIENIHYYKGRNVEGNHERYKLSLIKDILSVELKQCFLTNKGIAIGLPIIENSFDQSVSTAKMLPYKVYSIQNRNLHTSHNTYSSILFKDIDIDNTQKIFVIKADLQNDVYNMYVKNNIGELEIHDITAIPDYKTSVMMNKIFRKIKENYNLDALEESDDEDEFENIREDKYVDLNKSVNMVCSFNPRFNKYVPVSITNSTNIVHKSQVARNLY